MLTRRSDLFEHSHVCSQPRLSNDVAMSAPKTKRPRSASPTDARNPAPRRSRGPLPAAPHETAALQRQARGRTRRERRRRVRERRAGARQRPPAGAGAQTGQSRRQDHAQGRPQSGQGRQSRPAASRREAGGRGRTGAQAGLRVRGRARERVGCARRAAPSWWRRPPRSSASWPRPGCPPASACSRTFSRTCRSPDRGCILRSTPSRRDPGRGGRGTQCGSSRSAGANRPVRAVAPHPGAARARQLTP